MRSLLSGLVAALLVAVPVAAGTPMSDAERDAFRAEVRAYLLDNPEILTEMVSLLDAKQKAAAAENDRKLVAANAAGIFDDGYSFVGGNPNGNLTVVEFSDYDCAFCRKAFPDVQQMLAGDDQIRLIIKETPILGPGSELGARAAIATLIGQGPDAYRRLNTAMMTFPGPITDAALDVALGDAGLDPATVRAGMHDPEVDRRLSGTLELAQTLGVSGTPTFVVGKQLVRGYIALADLRDLVAQQRAAD